MGKERQKERTRERVSEQTDSEARMQPRMLRDEVSSRVLSQMKGGDNEAVFAALGPGISCLSLLDSSRMESLETPNNPILNFLLCNAAGTDQQSMPVCVCVCVCVCVRRGGSIKKLI